MFEIDFRALLIGLVLGAIAGLVSLVFNPSWTQSAWTVLVLFAIAFAGATNFIANWRKAYVREKAAQDAPPPPIETINQTGQVNGGGSITSGDIVGRDKIIIQVEHAQNVGGKTELSTQNQAENSPFNSASPLDFEHVLQVPTPQPLQSSRSGSSEAGAQEPKVYLREQSPNEVLARINSLKPLERELFANQSYIGRWVRWGGRIGGISGSTSFLKGGKYTVTVTDRIFSGVYAHLEFLPTERHLVEPLEEGDLISYEAQITRALGNDVYLTNVTFTPSGERSVVNITPQYLMRFFENYTEIQARTRVADFIGKWIRVSGPLGDISSSAQVTFADRSPTHMFFHKKKWGDRLSILSRGDHITVLGQIAFIESGNLVLDNCELIDFAQ